MTGLCAKAYLRIAIASAFVVVASGASAENILMKGLHSVGSFFVGKDPEKRILDENEKRDDEIFDGGVRALAQRMANLTLCVPGNASNGSSPSTLEWYLGNTLGGWADSLREDFNPASPITFETHDFEKTFEEAIAAKLPNGKAPESFRQMAQVLSRVSLEVARAGRGRDKTYAGSSAALRTASREAQKELSRLIENHYATRSALSPNCDGQKRGSAYYGTPRFRHRPENQTTAAPARRDDAQSSNSQNVAGGVQQPAPTKDSTASAGAHRAPASDDANEDAESLKKKKGLLTALAPSTPEQTQKLIDIAYDESKKNRGSFGTRTIKTKKGSYTIKYRLRTVTGVKDSATSLGACAMYVAISLARAGCVPSGFAVGSAFNIGSALDDHGFVNIFRNGKLPSGMDSLDDLPPGAVIEYSGGAHGHVEIKSNNGYVSDYSNSRARTGSGGPLEGNNRKVKGIWIKPSCGAGKMP